MNRTRLTHVELKTGFQDDGPAWIGRVAFSKSGRTVYFNGKALKRGGGQGIAGNHVDAETGEEYWVSGVKRDGADRHRCGSGKISIDARVVADYLAIVGADRLDPARFEVVTDIAYTDLARLHDRENTPL